MKSCDLAKGGCWVLLTLALVLAGCEPAEVGGGSGKTDPSPVLDGGPKQAPVSAPAPETCDGYDNDGDGVVDEGCSCKTGATAACYPGPKGQDGLGICKKGTFTCQGDAEFGTWGACTGAVTAQKEICGNGVDEDCDGSDLPCAPDAGAAKPVEAGVVAECKAGQKQLCYTGPAGTMLKGICIPGWKTCQTTGKWGPCAGEVLPKPEACNNGVDEDCNGKDTLCPGTLTVPLNISGDCVTASCPPNAPYPVGCLINFDGGDHRGCVASSPNSSVVYFQEGDNCKAGHLSGTLFCSSTPGAPLNMVSCPINKMLPFYPSSAGGCPPVS